MKKALILGTGAAQRDAIEYLKSEGWWVISCSYVRSGPGLHVSDQFELIDITDVDELERLARREGIDLIYSVGSDLAMPSVAEVAGRLGLRSFISPEIATLLQDKNLLRDFLARRGISPVRYQPVRTARDLLDWDVFPAMMKPADSQGQRGVFRADSMADILNRLDEAMAFSRSGTVIVEEFLEGPEISANVLIVNGRVLVNELSDRLVVDDFPGGIPLGHSMPPSHIPDDMFREARALTEQCVLALGIENGPVYFQLKLTASGPRIIEIAPRLDGCHIWRLIREVRGIDLLDASFRLLSGAPLGDLSVRKGNQAASLMFFLQKPGTEFLEDHHPKPEGASYVEYALEDGQMVPEVNGHAEKVGYYIIREASCESR